MTPAPLREPVTPWHRQPYVWLLIAFPALSVIVGLTMLFIAAYTFDGLVVDDYYKRGMEINVDLGRDNAAMERGLGAAMQFEPGAARFRILLTAAPGQIAPETLQVGFLHRTRAGFDQHIVAGLRPDAAVTSPFVYEAATPSLVRGRWDVLIESGDWRLLDSVTMP